MVVDFVRITFRPNGGTRDRKAWAEAATVRPDGTLAFWIVNKAGERPSPEEVVIGKPERFTVEKAVMNNRYCELEVV